VRKTLTDKGVAALKPRAKRYAFPDPELGGHYVRIQTSGAKAFVAVARTPNGRQIWTTIGTTDVISIAEAREQARDIIRRVRAGLSAIEAKADTVADVVADWVKRYAKPKGLRTLKETKRLLELHVLSEWRDREFTMIKRREVLPVSS
jgi:hypothetical protein